MYVEYGVGGGQPRGGFIATNLVLPSKLKKQSFQSDFFFFFSKCKDRGYFNKMFSDFCQGIEK